MTFLEAAIELLRREGRPLGSQQLAELAVRSSLLSVVGRDPAATMEQRLAEALKKSDGQGELVQVRPGVYGLRSYPPKPAHAAPPATRSQAQKPAEAGSRRRRRPAPEQTEREATGTAGEPAAGNSPSSSKAEGGGAEDQEERGGADVGTGRRRRRRGSRGGRAKRKRAVGAEPASAAPELPPPELPPPELPAEADVGELVEPPARAPLEAEAPATVDEELLAGSEEADPYAYDLDVADLDAPSGPVLAPASGAEDVVRTEDDRALGAAILGKASEDRRRHLRGREQGRRRGRTARGAQKEGAGAQPRAVAPQAAPPAPRRERDTTAPATPAPPPSPEVASASAAPAARETASRPRPDESADGKRRGLVEAAVEVLRSGEGRALHVRQLADLALKRRLLTGDAGELQRQLRLALLRESREREAEGLRPRLRHIGGGQFVLQESKLEPELGRAERELHERSERLREATRAAIRRRIGRMSPPSFEVLVRTLLERMGLGAIDLVRRGEGVAYFGAARPAGVEIARALVAVRPGESPIDRRAIGELRAGLKVRGFGEGWLLAAGPMSPDATAELKAGGQVTVYDGAALSALLLVHRLGVKRLMMPLDYLDVELWSELTD